MHRRPLLEHLDRFERCYPDERSRVSALRERVLAHSDCFERSCLPGHVTASAWIVSHDHSHFLMTFHRKLRRWLQLGGHADGESRVEEVALREAQEESGMGSFRWAGGVLEPRVLDVDIHGIPARGEDPAHEHWDVRFLLVAEPEQELRMSEESTDLRWFPWRQLSDVADEPSLMRMALRARHWLDLRPDPGPPHFPL